MVWCATSSNAGIVPHRCLQEGAEPEGKTFHLPIDVHSNPHLALGSEQKNEITDTRAKMGFLHKGGELSLRDRIRSLDNWRLHGVKPLLLCPERSQLGWFEHLISVCSVFGDCLEKLQVLLLK